MIARQYDESWQLTSLPWTDLLMTGFTGVVLSGEAVDPTTIPWFWLAYK